MDSQVVQNQEYLLTSILDQGLQEFTELVGVKWLYDDHPAGLALVGDGGDHGEFLAGATHCQSHGGLACWCEASATHIGVGQGGLVTSMNFSTFTFGTLLDAGVFAL